MTTGVFSERRLGDHLLVAPLSEDCLGTVFRALHSSDDNRFLRLRILQSPELSPPEVFDAVRKNARWVSVLAHKAIVQRAELGIADGVPFVAWQESAGWSLDLLLARLRATGTQLPVEHSLLIAERVAAALEHAWSTPVNGERIRHGLLWPGFVSISNDAEIRTGGFGLAEAVLPSLRKGRLARDIAPYLAPEVREGTVNEASSDAYSIGVLLHELLTCRRPTLGPPLADFRSGDPFPPEIRPILEKCFAPAGKRFSSPTELHRALLELLAATSYYSVSTISLALFLYKLLNPESHGLPVTDAESTNPVEGDLPLAPAVGASPQEALPRRRLGDQDSLPITGAASQAEMAEGLLNLLKPTELTSIETPRPRISSGLIRPLAPHRTRAPFFALAAAILVGLTLWTFRHEAPAPTLASIAPGAVLPDAMMPPTEAAATPALTPLERQIRYRAARHLSAETGQVAPGRSKVARARSAASGGPTLVPAVNVTPEERRTVESLRFEAGIARVEAERLEAHELAADQFSEARIREREGEELFHMESYVQALAAFDRAAGLYRMAENISRERRVERVKIASD